MTYHIPCPICKQLLKPSGNPNTLMCGARKVFVEELNIYLDTIHAMYCFNEDGSLPFRVIEVPPYAFEIQEVPEKRFFQTRIQKVISLDKKSPGYLRFHRETLLILPGIISCQWDNKEAVYEKIKMLMLFS